MQLELGTVMKKFVNMSLIETGKRKYNELSSDKLLRCRLLASKIIIAIIYTNGTVLKLPGTS